MLDRCQQQRRTADLAALPTQRPAGCSPAGAAANIATDYCKAISRAQYSPVPSGFAREARLILASNAGAREQAAVLGPA
jgi:hypothetical protein